MDSIEIFFFLRHLYRKSLEILRDPKARFKETFKFLRVTRDALGLECTESCFFYLVSNFLTHVS